MIAQLGDENVLLVLAQAASIYPSLQVGIVLSAAMKNARESSGRM